MNTHGAGKGNRPFRLTFRVSELVRGRRGITADTDLRLARYFGLSDGYWLALQNSFDMIEAKRAAADSIARISPYDQTA